VKAYTARDTNGQSIAAFFRTLLAARPPAQPSVSVPAPGDTARPAEAVQMSSPGSNGEIASPAPVAAQPGKDGLVSFDDFFGSAAAGSSSAPGGEPGKDDLDQFHSWLQNLKR
jgi:hypothetical protein